jgi:hypothetical protein
LKGKKLPKVESLRLLGEEGTVVENKTKYDMIKMYRDTYV